MLRWKNCFQSQKGTVLLTLLTKRNLNCNDFLPTNGRTLVNCFLGANKYTTFFNINIIQIFLDAKPGNHSF